MESVSAEIVEQIQALTEGRKARNAAADRTSVTDPALTESKTILASKSKTVPPECRKPKKVHVEHEEEPDLLKIKGVLPNVICIMVLICCAAMAAGLTVGLLSIEPLEMAIKQRSGTEDERKQATCILPLITRHHHLLVTLLLFNSVANEALPVFLDNLMPAWMAVVSSVTLILFFGEILPSAFFTGPNQFAMAAATSYFTWGLMAVLSPIAWPIAKALDYMLGTEGYRRYNRAEISALVEVQRELSRRDSHDLDEDPLHADEVAIVNGVLQASEKSVADAMVTMDKVYSLSIDAQLDENTMADIIAAGYSRVLVYSGEDSGNIRGYLQVKKLIVLNPGDARCIKSLVLRVPEVVGPQHSLLHLLNTFQLGRTHIAIVSHSPKLTREALRHGLDLSGAARPVGIITLEDIIEEILQEEIYDESDRLASYIEARAKATVLKYTRRKVHGRRISRLSAVGDAVLATREAGPGIFSRRRSHEALLSRSGRSLASSSSKSPSHSRATSRRSSPSNAAAALAAAAAASKRLDNSGHFKRMEEGGASVAPPTAPGSGSPVLAYDQTAAGRRSHSNGDAAAAAAGGGSSPSSSNIGVVNNGSEGQGPRAPLLPKQGSGSKQQQQQSQQRYL